MFRTCGDWKKIKRIKEKSTPKIVFYTHFFKISTKFLYWYNRILALIYLFILFFIYLFVFILFIYLFIVFLAVPDL